jgi:hypothetical protein
MKRLIYFLLVIAPLGGCASSTGTHSGTEIDNAATIAGSWIMKDGVELPSQSIMVEAIDGREVERDAQATASFQSWRVSPGAREVSIRLRKRSGAGHLSVSVYPPALVALLEPDMSYRLRAEYVRGSMVTYWLEEEPTGHRVSPLYFDPPAVPDNLALEAARYINVGGDASISSSIPGLFVLETELSAGENCPILVREVPVIATDTHPVLMTMGVILMVGIPALSGEPSGISAPNAKYDMEYQVFRGPCFDVQPGHEYQVRPVEKYAKTVSSPRTRGTKEVGLDTSTLLQIMDLSDNELVVWQFQLKRQKRYR